MSESQQLLLILTAVYLVDCLQWNPRHAAVFLSWNWRSWKLRWPNDWFGNGTGGFTISNPLPPLGGVFCAQPWPIAVTEDGISSPNLETPNPGVWIQRPNWFLPWESITDIRAEERAIVLNETCKTWTTSAAAAHELCAILTRCKNAAPEERADLIRRELARSFNETRAKRRIHAFKLATRSLRWSTNQMFVYTFLVLPVSYLFLGDSWRFLVLAGIAWLQMWQIGYEFFRLHRKWFPQLKMSRWQGLFACLVFPPSTIRCTDSLSRLYFGTTHPLALGAALLSSKTRDQTASTILRDVEHPLPLPDLGSENVFSNATTFHREFLQPTVADFCARNEIKTQAGLPSRHCPRCHAEFEEQAETCPDCGDLPLVAAAAQSS